MTTTTTHRPIPAWMENMIDEILSVTDDDRIFGSVEGAVEMFTEGHDLRATEAIKSIHRHVTNLAVLDQGNELDRYLADRARAKAAKR